MVQRNTRSIRRDIPSAEPTPLDQDFLYDAYRFLLKRQTPPRQENMAGMIGTVFWLASSNMIFTADVMSNYGLIVRKTACWEAQIH